MTRLHGGAEAQTTSSGCAECLARVAPWVAKRDWSTPPGLRNSAEELVSSEELVREELV